MTYSDTAPIALFVYNRLDHTKKTVEALLANPGAARSELTIFSDAPKSPLQADQVANVRAYISSIRGFSSLSIVKRDRNFGLKESIISGVGSLMKSHGRAIVLEDDIVTAPGFLTFMNEGLKAYERNTSIFAISGWAPPIQIPPTYQNDVYLAHRAMCWGWASWADRWEKIDWDVKDHASFDRDRKAKALFSRGGEDLPDMLRNSVNGRISSWAIRWAYGQFRQNALSVVPVVSLTENVGMDGTGINCSSEHASTTFMDRNKLTFEFPAELFEDAKINAAFRKFHSYNIRGKIKKALGLL